MNLSRKILIGEAVLIALPLTVLAFFGVSSTFNVARDAFWTFGAAGAEARWRRPAGIKL